MFDHKEKDEVIITGENHIYHGCIGTVSRVYARHAGSAVLVCLSGSRKQYILAFNDELTRTIAKKRFNLLEWTKRLVKSLA